MNKFDDKIIEEQSFSYRELIGQDRWSLWTPVFGSLTVVGATSYTGRTRMVGKQCFFQVKFSAATSIASVAGTDYLNLPFTGMGVAGQAIMTNDTSNIAVGNCHIDSTASRCYLPSQIASGNVFNISGWFEI
jgi:hypothetical protein